MGRMPGLTWGVCGPYGSPCGPTVGPLRPLWAFGPMLGWPPIFPLWICVFLFSRFGHALCCGKGAKHTLRLSMLLSAAAWCGAVGWRPAQFTLVPAALPHNPPLPIIRPSPAHYMYRPTTYTALPPHDRPTTGPALHGSHLLRVPPKDGTLGP